VGESQGQPLALDDGSRIGVVGGGPAGSFFSYFLLEMSRRVGLNLTVDIYEPRDFSQIGPQGCNMCGGIISESLVQALAVEGIKLPPAVVQRGIDSYFLHMDVGSVRIETPLQEKRIAAVHRGCGPRDLQGARYAGFDNFLLELAIERGAQRKQKRVMGVTWDDGRPRVKAQGLEEETYDLLAIAVGINSPALKFLQALGVGYQPPTGTKTYIRELCLGQETIRKYLGSSMHVFLLSIPRLEFAALIPKGDYVTLCLLGHDIDKELIQQFLESPEVRRCMPPSWEPPVDSCHCSPRISMESAVQPFADRLVFATAWFSWVTAGPPDSTRMASALPTAPPRQRPRRRCSREFRNRTFRVSTGRLAGHFVPTTGLARWSSLSPPRFRSGVSPARVCGEWFRASNRTTAASRA
jgi:hypothetical protein